jgi:hypothetical protein
MAASRLDTGIAKVKDEVALKLAAGIHSRMSSLDYKMLAVDRHRAYEDILTRLN